MIIQNKNELLSHGNVKGREVVLDVAEYAIEAVDAYKSTKNMIHIKDDSLIIKDLTFDIKKVRNIYVVGGGKATFSIARALDEILGERITRGTIIVKRGEKRRLKNIKVLEAGHPIPDEAGYEGAQEIMEIAKEASENDLVFCAITGGASALMPFPVKGISLEDKIRVTELLLKCGATIDEINAVRNHISEIKGGRLAKYLHPAEIINLIIIDEVAGQPWGPTVPDTSTFQDSVRVLKKYGLWRKVPVTVKGHLKRGISNPHLETLKEKDFESFKVHNIVLADNNVMCEAAKRRAEELGYDSLILSTKLEGESREVGIVLASIANEVEKDGRPIKPPCFLILGGETTVTLTGRTGMGGPSQELVLGASLKIAGSEKIVIASMDTDGTDGPTEIAGGIVDGYTSKRACKIGLDIFKVLKKHNSSEALIKLGDAIITGPTETNVMDLNLIAIIN
ncbi:MAG: glycerate kinase [Candidatus Bathyarchaeia archaeon]